MMRASTEYIRDTTSFTPSSRARGTGMASRYRRLPQLASLATVSPRRLWSSFASCGGVAADQREEGVFESAPWDHPVDPNAGADQRGHRVGAGRAVEVDDQTAPTVRYGGADPGQAGEHSGRC